ncbi:MAG TPA: zinc-ribbon and DUF3426 domain-containing protein [Burkholderiales bacterium]|nr:zinc-ribbon and DUF3426 domain-containing protein [Burkholderiales bacterium]
MNLYTRCPHCDTVFRVTTRDLQASSGRVRCGHCQSVFDAFATLTAQEPATDQAASGIHQAELVAALHTAEQFGGSDDRVAQSAADRLESGAASRAADARATAGPVVPPGDDDPAASLYEWEFRLPPARPRTGLWATLALLMLLAAAAQAAVGFRSEILVTYPQTRALYERACSWMGCQVGLPRLAERIHIETSDLQFVDPGRPNEIELSVLVRNRASVAMDYPAFELTLTNAQEQVVARRVFLPREYLDEPERMPQGLPPRAELPVRLSLDTGNVRAAGYRVYFFYP